ncbi:MULTISPECIES: SDR family oxidoreductase [Haloferax]|uniref:SDR family oxidoreductase n=1 Tax=Haloferax marinum TaxID=2666143 RepID=A0A6A8GBA7_9EURY|nr:MULTISPECIES: SDR family oxidoreductase [Haloferax]KAB1190658.1 SDR family oxidoreductase [Haloferax sp. CBA1150]MRW98187.1 SDR family oxidoreductase [Haloferax marinum]
MNLEIEGNAALVTASSSGLGKASAKALAEEGVDVVINGRDEDRLAEAKAEIEEVATGDVVAVAGDLTDADDTERLVEETIDAFGRLDHLVTSAGGPPSGAFLDTDDEDWQHAYDLLVMSVVRLARAAEPHLRENDGGTIVNITSRSVKEAIDSLVLSNAVRMGVIGLEKTLSKEFAPEIRTNAVLPGPHETSRIRDLVNAAVDRGEYDSYEEGLADWSKNPLEQIGEPESFGTTVAFLCSPKSGHVNGTALPIDGGSTGANL